MTFGRNVIKIDPYNFELYRFKVGAFLRHSVVQRSTINAKLRMTIS